MKSNEHRPQSRQWPAEQTGRPSSRRARTLNTVAPIFGGVLVVIIAALALGTVTYAGAPTSRAAGPTATDDGTAAVSATPKRTKTVSAAGGVVNEPITSAGCGHAPAIAPGTSAEVSVLSGGRTRAFRLHVPTGYDPNIAWRLIVNYHGGGSTDAMYERYTGQSADADLDGFLVAYPQGLPGTDGQQGWGGTGVGQPQVDDVLFTSDMLTAIQGAYCVDPQRIYVMGYSRGGGMAAILACKLGGRVAAFAIVSGTYLASIEHSCAPTRAVPILEFHGTADPTAPYTGGGSENFLPVPQWLNNWVTRDGCTGAAATFFQQSGVTGEEWLTCTQGGVVAHYVISGWGHQWMRATPANMRPLDDTAAAWAFFVAHPLPTQLAPTSAAASTLRARAD